MHKAMRKLEEHLSLPASQRQTRRPPIDREITASKEILESLTNLQRSRCAFCEISIGEYLGGLQLYPPATNATGEGQDRSESNRYSWFAYEWRNMHLSCVTCSAAKISAFPISGLAAPFLSSWQEANDIEDPLLLDPSVDEPALHLAFDANGLAKGLTSRGAATINVFDLNRPELLSLRRDCVSDCLTALEGLRNGDRTARDLLSSILSGQAPHPGSTYIFLRTLANNLAVKQRIALPRSKWFVEDFMQLCLRTDDQDWEAAISAKGSDVITTEEPLLRSFESESQFSSIQKRSGSSKITGIHVKNFKGIGELYLSFPDSTKSSGKAPSLMLLGENATGKSTVLQAVSLCLMGERLRKKMKLNVEDFVSRDPGSWNLVGDKKCEVSVTFESGDPAKLEINSDNRTFGGTHRPAAVVLAYGPHRIFPDRAERMTSPVVCRSLFRSTSPIPSPLEWLEQVDSRTFDAMARALREILMLRDEDEIVRDDHGHVLVVAHGRDTPIDRLSEGYRSLIGMAVDVMREMISVWGDLEQARGLVIIDEVEANLHPRWKVRIMDAMRRAMPNAQFLVTTHDPLCVRGMENGEVVVLVRNGQEEIEALTDLPDVKGLRAEQLLTSDYFGLNSTADVDTEVALEQFSLRYMKGGISLADDLIIDDQVKSALEGVVQIGDNPSEVVVYEALRRYSADRAMASYGDRSSIKEGAVLAVLDALRNREEASKS